MSGCDEHQIELSALIDGESDPGAIIAALDHLVGCSRCRQFYAELRSFQDMIDRAPAAAVLAVEAETVPEVALVSREQDENSRPRARAAAATHWGWNLAAVLVIAVGLSTLLLRQPVRPVTNTTSTGAAAARMSTKYDAMDDQRFAGLSVEILKADARYQRRMYALLADIGADGPQDEAPLSELLWRYATLSDRHDSDRYDFAIARSSDQGNVDNNGEVRATPESDGVLY